MKSVLSKKVAGLKPSGIRKFFDIAATMENVISPPPNRLFRLVLMHCVKVKLTTLRIMALWSCDRLLPVI